MAKNSRKADLAQVKKSLAILRKKGLYKPKSARAKPTSYGLSLLRKYRDVTAGRSYVVKAGKPALDKLSENYRVTRGRVVIPKMGLNVTPRITKTGDIIRGMKFENKRYRYRPAKMVDGEWPELGPFQTYEVQIRYGRRLSAVRAGSRSELLALINEYAEKNDRGFDISPFVMIAEPEGLLRVRIHFVQEGSRSKTRVVRVAHIEQAVDEFRYRFPQFADWIVTKVEPLG